jgi:histidyl-tRNA synthetase
MSAETTFTAPRGMRDFYPTDMPVRQAIFKAWSDAASAAGFDAYDACVVESLELLKRKGGEEIVDQIYCFKDKSDRDLALRAEMTPSLARMVAAKQNELVFPLKWYTIAQCFRYERMSRGRKREHYQWNLDIVGEKSLLAEAEVISTALDALRRLGLGDAVRVRINNRALLAELLEKTGVPRDHHAATFLALDKRGKIDDEALRTLLRDSGLAPEAIDAAFRLLQVQTLEEAEAVLGGPTPASQALRELFDLLALFGCAGAIHFDISVIRGLGYYTGIVFEGFDSGLTLRALFGGGRYDNLLGDIGGRAETAVGLGFGDVVVAELLADRGLLPNAVESRDYAIGFMTEAQRAVAIAIAFALRRQGRRVDLGLHAEKPKNFFARSGKGSAALAIFIGPDDTAKGTVRIKNLADRSETEIPIVALTTPPIP